MLHFFKSQTFLNVYSLIIEEGPFHSIFITYNDQTTHNFQIVYTPSPPTSQVRHDTVINLFNHYGIGAESIGSGFLYELMLELNLKSYRFPVFHFLSWDEKNHHYFPNLATKELLIPNNLGHTAETLKGLESLTILFFHGDVNRPKDYFPPSLLFLSIIEETDMDVSVLNPYLVFVTGDDDDDDCDYETFEYVTSLKSQIRASM